MTTAEGTLSILGKILNFLINGAIISAIVLYVHHEMDHKEGPVMTVYHKDEGIRYLKPYKGAINVEDGVFVGAAPIIFKQHYEDYDNRFSDLSKLNKAALGAYTTQATYGGCDWRIILERSLGLPKASATTECDKFTVKESKQLITGMLKSIGLYGLETKFTLATEGKTHFVMSETFLREKLQVEK